MIKVTHYNDYGPECYFAHIARIAVLLSLIYYPALIASKGEVAWASDPSQHLHFV